VRAYAASCSPAEDELIAESRRARLLLETIARVAPTESSVLISGETGTGKTMVARKLHQQSASASLPLRVINCAALRDALLADALLELEREAAQRAAQHGCPLAQTVLLDEVGELSLWSQAVLLRKLQSAAETRPLVRLISATDRDVDVLVLRGTFSRELLVHLRAVRVPLAPLRDRREEIGPLALHFLRLSLRTLGLPFVSLENDFLRSLALYDWPGNARELKNAMIRTLAVNESGTLTINELPDAVRRGTRLKLGCDGP
jgi:DNA-binding NtrC family response regulator